MNLSDGESDTLHYNVHFIWCLLFNPNGVHGSVFPAPFYNTPLNLKGPMFFPPIATTKQIESELSCAQQAELNRIPKLSRTRQGFPQTRPSPSNPSVADISQIETWTFLQLTCIKNLHLHTFGTHNIFEITTSLSPPSKNPTVSDCQHGENRWLPNTLQDGWLL